MNEEGTSTDLDPGDLELNPPCGGSDPPCGGSDPPCGGRDPPCGGSDPPCGGRDPPCGGSDPPCGGSDPPCGGRDPPCGGSDPPFGGSPACAGDPDHQFQDPEELWVPGGRRLISGLLGLNLVLLGAALVAGQALNPAGLSHQEPRVFRLLLTGAGLVWMLWYLLWAWRRPGTCRHRDHHAGGAAVVVVLLFFAAFSLVLHVCRVCYLVSTRACRPAAALLAPFMEAPFLVLQTLLLWRHARDCVHKHKIITRCGLVVVLAADLLLWLSAVTEDSLHLEAELEKTLASGQFGSSQVNVSDSAEASALCRCSSTSSACRSFRKAVEILYPFHLEFYLMAGCMVYVMWKNVGRRTSPGPHRDPHKDRHQKLTVRVVYQGGVLYGPGFGVLALLAGVAVFILYQVWVRRPRRRLIAFLVFYGYHLAVLPVMALCSLAGVGVHRLDRRPQQGGHNPTRSLDVMLLVAAALGQIALSYFSLVAAVAAGAPGVLGGLDLSYSLLSLLELLLQNIFIIQGLHRHSAPLSNKQPSGTLGEYLEGVLLEGDATAPPAGQLRGTAWGRRATREICAFLIFCNIMLWLIPAFGVHPQLENGLGKRFFGFRAWLVLVNLSQPLGVFYRMHSVGALMELLVSA